jgi:hypothetical protein
VLHVDVRIVHTLYAGIRASVYCACAAMKSQCSIGALNTKAVSAEANSIKYTRGIDRFIVAYAYGLAMTIQT